MAKRIWLVLIVLGVSAPPATFAKPGDLPVDITQQCPDARETTRGEPCPAGDCLAARPWAGADITPAVRAIQPTERDASPRPMNQVRDVNHRVRRDAHGPALTPQDAEAARLFALGERCRRIGDDPQARVCYEEAHIASPASLAGRLAIERLREIDLIRRAEPLESAEEAETPEFVEPRRPATTPPDADSRRPQAGYTPERQPQLPALPVPGGAKSLRDANDKLKEMLKSTVPLGGAEEQETKRGVSKKPEMTLARFYDCSGVNLQRLDGTFNDIVEPASSENRPCMPFMVWTRVDFVADWTSATIYARPAEFGSIMKYENSPEPGTLAQQARRNWWAGKGSTVVGRQRPEFRLEVFSLRP